MATPSCLRWRCKSFEPLSKTYKAVFECEAYGERMVWYVSSHLEAQRMTRQQITSLSGKVLKRYKEVQYSVTITEVFQQTLEVYYDITTSWGRD